MGSFFLLPQISYHSLRMILRHMIPCAVAHEIQCFERSMLKIFASAVARKYNCQVVSRDVFREQLRRCKSVDLIRQVYISMVGVEWCEYLMFLFACLMEVRGGLLSNSNYLFLHASASGECMVTRFILHRRHARVTSTLATTVARKRAPVRTNARLSLPELHSVILSTHKRF